MCGACGRMVTSTTVASAAVPTGVRSPDPRRDFGAWYVTPSGDVYLIERYGDFLAFSYGRNDRRTRVIPLARTWSILMEIPALTTIMSHVPTVFAGHGLRHRRVGRDLVRCCLLRQRLCHPFLRAYLFSPGTTGSIDIWHLYPDGGVDNFGNVSFSYGHLIR